MSNHTGASTEELRDELVAVALDKVLLLHVGMELAKHYIEVEGLAFEAGAARLTTRSGGVQRRA